MKSRSVASLRHKSPSINFLLPFLVGMTLLIASCNGGGGGGSSDSGTVSTSVGSGSGGGLSIGGNGTDGPVSAGVISVHDSLGLCDSVITNQNATYSLVLDNGCIPPFKIELTGGLDLVTALDNDTRMLSLSLSSGRINVSPLTTIIYHAALARNNGSFTDLQSEDLNLVTTWATRKFNFGIDAASPIAGDFNPLTATIDTSNSIVFIKANEGLIETTRRVALLWLDAVNEQSIGQVLAALGEDISDGLLDGKTFDGSQTPEMARLSSLWEITTASVSMEMMLNRMRITLTDNQFAQEGVSELDFIEVNTGLAAAASTISSTSFSAANTAIQNSQPTRMFIDQARSAATAAQELATQALGSSSYGSFITALDTMRANLDASNATSTPIDGINQTLLTQISNDAETMLPSLEGVSELDFIGINPGRAAAASTIPNTSFNTANTALQQAVATMSLSTPVINNHRHVLVEWSYPNGTNHDGFKIYRQPTNSDPELLCDIANPAARSSAGYNCYIDNARPGDSVTLYMTAYSFQTESSPSSQYSNTIPQVQFKTNEPISGNCPLDIQFNGTDSPSPDQLTTRTYDWSFGDGESGSGAIPAFHYFDFANTYPVLLTITDTDYTGIFSTSSQAILDVNCW